MAGGGRCDSGDISHGSSSMLGDGVETEVSRSIARKRRQGDFP